MNRLVFEDDDVIQQALMMESDSNDDPSLIDSEPISSKRNIKKSEAKQGEKQNVLEKKKEENTNKKMEKDQDTKTKYQCPKCSQEFEKKELQNHDCAKKKRKSLVLSFHRKQSITPSLHAKNIRKSIVKNDTATFDNRNDVDTSTGEKIGKDIYKKTSKNQNTHDFDENGQTFESKITKTPIFYECPVCVKYYSKKEIDNHKCRDETPCLTLIFPMSSSFNDSMGKYDRNTSKRPKKSVSFEDFPDKYIETNNHEEQTQVKYKKDNNTSLFITKSKQPVTSQHFENEKVLKKQKISIKNDNQNASKNKKPIKRISPDSEMSAGKVYELRTKNRKIDKQNNETNQSVDTTLKDRTGDGNKIVAIKTRSQKSTPRNKDQSNNQKDTSKNENSKSLPFKNNAIVRNESSKVQHNQVRPYPKKKLINQIQKNKQIEKCCTVVLHKIDIEQNSDKLLKNDILSSKNIDKMSKRDAKSSDNVDKNVRLNVPRLIKNEKESTHQNLENKETEEDPSQNTQAGDANKEDSGTKNEICYSQKGEKATNVISPRNKISTTKKNRMKVNPAAYKMFRLNDLKVLLKKKGRNHLNLVADKVITRKIRNANTASESSNIKIETNQLQSKERKIVKKSDKLLRKGEVSQSTNRISKSDEKSARNNRKVISERYKLFRFNELKVLLEKEKAEKRGRSHLNLVADKITTQKERNFNAVNENTNNQEETKQLQSEERKVVKKSDKLLKQDEISQSTNRISNSDENSGRNINKKVISQRYKLFRFNELKVLLEKDNGGNRNLQNKDAKLITIEDSSNESKNSNNQQEKQSNRKIENVEADLSLNNSNGQEKLIKIESNQEDNTEKEIVKNNKRPNLQKKYRCRICRAIYTKNKNQKHICKNKVKKITSTKNKGQIVKKSDALIKKLKNNAQNKVNITILSRENVKVITVSNNPKEYEVNQGDISNYVHFDEPSKQGEIKEATKEILTNRRSTNKSSIETASQSKIIHIPENIATEKANITLNMSEKSKPITKQKHPERQNYEDIYKTILEKKLTKDKSIKSDTTSKELSTREEISKIQEKNTPLEEPQKQNKNGKDDEKELRKNLQNNSNSTNIVNTPSLNSDQIYITTDVENNLSINTVDIEHIVKTENIEHDMITKTTKNDTILSENKRHLNKNEINTNKNKENEIGTTENLLTSSENKKMEIIPINNKTTASEYQIITTTKYEENQLLESTKIVNILKNDLGSDGQKNSGNDDNVSIISTERISSIEIIDVFVCTRCSQEFSENEIKNHLCCKNTEINHLGKTPQLDKPKHSAVTIGIASVDNIESDNTVPEIVGREVTLPESEITDSESKIMKQESEITLPETVESDETISESVGNKFTISDSKTIITESETTVPETLESEITVTTQIENTTSTPDIESENFTNQNVANEVIITAQSEELGIDELTLEDNCVSIDNVAQEIIIPAVEEEITYEQQEIVSIELENPVGIATQIENDSFENVEQEVIITTENTETDDVSIENVGNEIVLTESVVTQNTPTIGSTKKRKAISSENVEHKTDYNLENSIIITNQIEGNDNIASTQTTENKKLIYNKSTGLINNDQHETTTVNRESGTKILSENIEHQIEKVSVENLENEVFILKYDETNDSIEDVQIETNVSTKCGKASALIEDAHGNKTNILKQDETSLTNNVELHESVKDVEDDTNFSTKCVRQNVSIIETNISTQNDNVFVKNTDKTIGDVTEVDPDQPTVNIINENDVFVQNEVTASPEKKQRIVSSEQSDKMTPTNSEIETIIIISSEEENKKKIILTQNEKNETVIIITKQKDEISAGSNTTPRVKEITDENLQIEHLVGNKEDIKTKNKRKCSKCLKTLIEDELKSHNCTTKGRNKIEESEITKFKTAKTLPKNDLNNHECDKNIGEKEKEDNTLSIETQLATILNRNDSQNKTSETQEHSSDSSETNKCDENKKEDSTLETQLAAILNQNESQNKMAHKQEHSRISSASNIRQDIENEETKGSPLTNNQLLYILSKSAEDTSQVEKSNKINEDITRKENNTKTRCFRCSKEYTDRELVTHNCLENEEKITSNPDIVKTSKLLKSQEANEKSDELIKNTTESKQNNDTVDNNILYVIEVKEKRLPDEKMSTDHEVPKTKCIRCFNCSKIYDKTHICSNIEKEMDNNTTSIEKPDKSEPKKNTCKRKTRKRISFDAYIIKENGIFKCKICKRRYKERKNLIRHMHQHEKGYDKEIFKCSICSKTFQYKNSLKAHEACHTGETYSCDICQASFSRKTNLYTHTKLHSNEKIPCNKCSKEYSSKQCYNNHPCFNTKIYPCKLCDKKYKQKCNLIDHLHAHVGVKPYQCEFCNEKFESRNKYSKHTENCSIAKQKAENSKKNEETAVNRQLSCKFCSKTLKNKSQLQKHEWRHENKHFLCNICPKKFKSKHYLQLHLTSHTELGIKRDKFECPDCDKKFATKFGLKLHLNLHTGVKFPCPLCEKLFTTKLLLQTHQRIHTGQNPFVCENCNKAFNNRSNFNRHVKNKACFYMPMEVESEEYLDMSS